LSSSASSYTAIASDTYGRHSTNTINVSLSTSITLKYDGNGNLTNDGLRTFAYDDENQLTQVAGTLGWSNVFVYDAKMRRRISKQYSSAGTETNEIRYIYDGNLVLQERNSANTTGATYLRGLDLSGTMQGAGGIGGLLAVTNPAWSQAFYYHSDGGGNVTMLVTATNTIAARYLYDAFGNILAKSGQMADTNLYRFSSKEADANSGLTYYLYRFYDPNLQRWINRDPFEEVGGINLYEFVRNSPIGLVDHRGLNACTDGCLDAMNNSLISGLPAAIGGGILGGMTFGHQTPTGGQKHFCSPRGGPSGYAKNLGRSAAGGLGLGILILETDAYSTYLGCIAGCPKDPPPPKPPQPPSTPPASCPPPPPLDCSENAPPTSVSN
jgi:RHS repeat-associated protein